MTGLDILYLGSHSGTSLDRANAYRRIGHRVTHLDPRLLLPKSVWFDRLIWHVGGAPLAPMLRRALRQSIGSKLFDLCHVDNGECISPSVVALLRRHCRSIVNYNIDDPFGGRDHRRFSAYCAALPSYDLAVVPRALNVPEALSLGARNVLCVYRSADEVSHAAVPLTDADQAQWASDVLFLGTWMPERGPFLLDLIRRGVRLTIRGSLWQKAPEWDKLRTAWRSDAVYGADYAKAIQCSRVNLGLLSKGNRDLHTTRSLEIPALGGLLCAERTQEHVAMYDEGKEALFWSDAAECAEQCFRALSDEPRRRRIAAAGQARMIRNGHYNEVVMQRILNETGLQTLRSDDAPTTCVIASPAAA